MAFPTQWAKTKFNFADDDGPWENIVWWTINGAFASNFDIAAAATSIDTSFASKFSAYMGTDTIYAGVDLSVNNAGIVSSSSTYPSVSGAASSTAMPNEVAAIVRLQSDQPGRSGHGRIFVAGIAQEFCIDGRLNTLGHTKIQALGTQIQTHLTIQTQSWHACVHSKVNDDLHDILTTSAPLIFGTQRKRRPKR